MACLDFFNTDGAADQDEPNKPVEPKKPDKSDNPDKPKPPLVPKVIPKIYYFSQDGKLSEFRQKLIDKLKKDFKDSFTFEEYKNQFPRAKDKILYAAVVNLKFADDVISAKLKSIENKFGIDRLHLILYQPSCFELPISDIPEEYVKISTQIWLNPEGTELRFAQPQLEALYNLLRQWKKDLITTDNPS